MENKYQFTDALVLDLPEAYTMVRASTGLAHIAHKVSLQAYCSKKVISGLYSEVPQAPEIVKKKCQNCFIKTPSHWLTYTGGYAGSRVNANRGDGDR